MARRELEYELTDRDIDVINAVAAYGGNGAAAFELNITEQTVKNHLTRIIRATGSRTTLQSYFRLTGNRKVVRKVTTIISYEGDPNL